MDDLSRALRAHPFLHDLEPAHVALLVGCAKNVRYRAGEYVLREGDDASTFFLVRHGTISLEVAVPGREPVVVETVGPGDVLGLSWMIGGATTHLDCRAREAVVAFSLDATCLRDKMNADHHLGYALTSRLLERAYERLARVRLQKLDVYG